MPLKITSHTLIAEKDDDVDIFAELGDYEGIKLFNEKEYLDRILPLDYDKEYVLAGNSKEVFSGTYKTWNKYRNLLSEIFCGAKDEDVWDNLDKYRDKPLFELIDFTDAGGMLGPEVCKKLYKDLVDNRDHFIQKIKDQDALEYEWNVQTWDDLTEAFKDAMEHGMVQFHT